MTGLFGLGTVDGVVALAALAAAVLCLADATRPVVSGRMAWSGIAAIFVLLGANLGALGPDSLAPGAVLGSAAWFLTAAIGAFVLFAQLVCERVGTDGYRAPTRTDDITAALGFSAFAAFVIGAAADTGLALVAAVELGAAAAFGAAVVHGHAPPRSTALPLAATSLAILVGEFAGLGMVAGAAGSARFADLTAPGIAASPGFALGMAVFLGALTARFLWLCACYGAAVRHDRTGSVHLTLGALVLPGAALAIAHVFALGGPSLAPAFGLAAQIGFAIAGLAALRSLIASRTLGDAVAWTAIVSGLTILFAAVYLGARPGPAVLVLTVQAILGISVLALSAGGTGDGGPGGYSRRIGLVSAAFAAAAGLGLAGVPPFLGFWGRWTFIDTVVARGPAEVLAVLMVISLGLVAAWARIWFGLWTQALASHAPRAQGQRRAAETGLAAFFTALIVLLSLWPGPVVGAHP